MVLELFTVFLLALDGGPAEGEQLRAAEVAFAIRAAVCSSDGCDERRGLVLAVTAAEESRGRGLPRVRGDSGRACGRVQLGSVARAGRTCDELDADAELDARTALAALHTFEKHCGSFARGLGAYATGSCDRGEWYAKHRCKLAGVDCSTAPVTPDSVRAAGPVVAPSSGADRG